MLNLDWLNSGKDPKGFKNPVLIMINKEETRVSHLRVYEKPFGSGRILEAVMTGRPQIQMADIQFLYCVDDFFGRFPLDAD